MSQIQYEEGTLEQLEEKYATLNRECNQMQQNIDRSGGHRYEVKYRDPEPGFDRRKVKGMVCRLFDVRDARFITALSATAGGSLTSLVVEDEISAKKILERGDLQTRINIIPISKIRGHTIHPNKIRLAQNLVGAENCIPAIDLIQYDQSLKNVMEYVFGSTFICPSIAIAKKVTFHPQIMQRTITLDGDSLDPSGSLSGGAVSKDKPFLLEVSEFKERLEQLTAKRNELQQIQREIVEIKPTATAYNALKQQLDAAEYELKSIKMLLAQTSYQQHQQEIEDLRAKIGKKILIVIAQ